MSEYTLADADEPTLRELSGPGKPLACRWCARCDHHYRFCTCTEPYWMCRAEGKLGPLPGEPGGMRSIGELISPVKWPDWNGT